MQDHPQTERPPRGRGQKRVQLELQLHRIIEFGETKSLREACDVGVDRKAGKSEGDASYDIAGLAAHAGEGDEIVEVGRNLAIEAPEQRLGHADQASGLVLIEAGRVDDVLHLGRVRGRKINGCGESAEQCRRHHVDPGICGLRGQDGRSKKLEWVGVIQFAHGFRVGLSKSAGHLDCSTLWCPRRCHGATLCRRRPFQPRSPGGVGLASLIVWRIETRRELGRDELVAVRELVDEAASDDGFRSLSDHLWLDLVNGGGPGYSAALAIDEAGRIGGYAQLSEANQSTTIELVIATGHRAETAELAPLLLRATIAIVAAKGGGQVNWWVQPGTGLESVADTVSLRLGRRLLEMRRSLPIDETTAIDTRAFVVGKDETEWLRVNNAAFHGHPEQGGWTIDTLRQRQAESWFDPEGFRLHERDGKLAAFCWTKVHKATTPPMGEIYVIAVDPEFHGHGLGRELTIAGLQHLAAKGLTVGMLYVDAANVAAMSLYQRLGFSIDHANHAYVGDVPSTQS